MFDPYIVTIVPCYQNFEGNISFSNCAKLKQESKINSEKCVIGWTFICGFEEEWLLKYFATEYLANMV